MVLFEEYEMLVNRVKRVVVIVVMRILGRRPCIVVIEEGRRKERVIEICWLGSLC